MSSLKRVLNKSSIRKTLFTKQWKQCAPGNRYMSMKKLTDFEKKTLVKAKYFRDIKSVPDQVPYHMLKKAEDIGRVRRNIIMFAMTIVAVIVTIFVGRTQQRTGQSVSEVQLREIQRLRDEGLREAASKGANS